MDTNEPPLINISRQRASAKYHVTRMIKEQITRTSYSFKRMTLCGKVWNYQNERAVRSHIFIKREYHYNVCENCVEKLRIEVITHKLTN